MSYLTALLSQLQAVQAVEPQAAKLPASEYDPESSAYDLDDEHDLAVSLGQRSPFYGPTPSPSPEPELLDYRPSSPPRSDQYVLPEAKTQELVRPKVQAQAQAPEPGHERTLTHERTWTLSPESLLDTLDRRLRPRRSEALVAACEDLAAGFGGLLFVDASLLRLLPAGAVSEADGRAMVSLVQAQLALFENQARTPASPLARFVAPQYDPRRLGFVVGADNCAQGGLAVVPFRLARVNSRQQLVLAPETPPGPDQAETCRKNFLLQTAALCRALGASDVPTLSAAAARRDRVVPDVVVSSKHAGVHPVLRAVGQLPDKFSLAMNTLRAEIDKSGSLAQYLARFQTWSTACVSVETHTRWAAGLCADLLADAWPVRLELLEAAEISAVVAAVQNHQTQGRSRGRERDSRAHRPPDSAFRERRGAKRAREPSHYSQSQGHGAGAYANY